MQVYQTLHAQHSQQYTQHAQRYNLMSLARLVVAVCFFVCWYAYIYQQFLMGLWAMGTCAVLFLALIKIHATIGWNMRLQRALVRINEDEMAYLQHKKLPFADGAEYATPDHAYANDLDILGKNSLFQHLNRTTTYIGKTKLARLLLQTLPTDAIQQNQEAIQELRPRTEGRQAIQALGKLHEDSAQVYEKLIAWSKTDTKSVPALVLGLSYVLPAVFGGLCAMAYFSPKPMWGGLAFLMFLVNLAVLFSQMGKIKKETQQAENIGTFLPQYSTILERIEQEAFTSPRLQALQKQLTYQTGTASRQVRTLSSIFHELDSLDNVIGALLFNGSLLYHIRSWHNLLRWKAQYAPQIGTWLDVIGEIEALQSLANFAHNHANYTFPTLNNDYQIRFEQVAHPLLASETSVKNDVHFKDYQFIILTGSNMSGKSTFLRTLGVNMVLSGIGAPVCASKANIHPLPVWVSMRLSDSLQDSESYFFAEVKRLKEIMTAVQTQTCFVLLDEILRGTNSDDKRSGTIGVIKKMIAQRAYGAIATHDIEVCLTTADYPEILSNQCFEVKIVNDELVFDYKLREGVCQNKSATFLMQKMEII